MGNLLSSANLRVIILGAVSFVVGMWLYDKAKALLP